MITRFLHTAFSVDNLQHTIAQYSNLGYGLEKQFEKPEPHALVAHMTNGDSTIEIWQFMDTEHPQASIIKRHIALESDNLDADILDLVNQGFEVVIPKTKGVVLTYVFVKDASGNYIEIASRE